jgi:AcrR family transcriptional regulator
MKRPSKNDEPTKDLILDAATRLFYSRGLRAVSLEEIAAAADLTKRTLYYHFPTKEDLIVAYLDRWKNRARPQDRVGSASDPVALLLSAFDVLAREVAKPTFRGCPFVNAAAEINDSTHAGTKIAMAHKEARVKWFESLLKQAHVAAPAKLARQILLLWEGAMVRAFITHSAKPVREAREAVATLIAAAK